MPEIETAQTFSEPEAIAAMMLFEFVADHERQSAETRAQCLSLAPALAPIWCQVAAYGEGYEFEQWAITEIGTAIDWSVPTPALPSLTASALLHRWNALNSGTVGA